MKTLTYISCYWLTYRPPCKTPQTFGNLKAEFQIRGHIPRRIRIRHGIGGPDRESITNVIKMPRDFRKFQIRVLNPPRRIRIRRGTGGADREIIKNVIKMPRDFRKFQIRVLNPPRRIRIRRGKPIRGVKKYTVPNAEPGGRNGRVGSALGTVYFLTPWMGFPLRIRIRRGGFKTRI